MTHDTCDAPQARRRRRMRSLYEVELLAIVLREDGESIHVALERARAILIACNGVSGLARLSKVILGRQALDDHRTAMMLAAVRFGLRMAKAMPPPRSSVFGLDDQELIAGHAPNARDDRRILGALFFDHFGYPKGVCEILELPAALERLSERSRSQEMLDQPILQRGVLCSARYFLLFHRRRGVGAEPHVIDRQLSDRMREAAERLGCRLLDYLILDSSGQCRWLSALGYPLWPQQSHVGVEVPATENVGRDSFPSREAIAMLLDVTAYGEGHTLMPHVVRWLIQQHPETRQAWDALTRHRGDDVPSALELARLLCAADGIDGEASVQTARWLIQGSPRARAHMLGLEAMARDLGVMGERGWPRRVLRQRWEDERSSGRAPARR